MSTTTQKVERGWYRHPDGRYGFTTGSGRYVGDTVAHFEVMDFETGVETRASTDSDPSWFEATPIATREGGNQLSARRAAAISDRKVRARQRGKEKIDRLTVADVVRVVEEFNEDRHAYAVVSVVADTLLKQLEIHRHDEEAPDSNSWVNRLLDQAVAQEKLERYKGGDAMLRGYRQPGGSKAWHYALPGQADRRKAEADARKLATERRHDDLVDKVQWLRGAFDFATENVYVNGNNSIGMSGEAFDKLIERLLRDSLEGEA